MSSSLIGYVRRSNDKIKVSVNVDAFNDCNIWTTSDGQQYVALEISMNALNKVINGERVVTSMIHHLEDGEDK